MLQRAINLAHQPNRDIAKGCIELKRHFWTQSHRQMSIRQGRDNECMLFCTCHDHEAASSVFECYLQEAQRSFACKSAAAFRVGKLLDNSLGKQYFGHWHFQPLACHTSEILSSPMAFAKMFHANRLIARLPWAVVRQPKHTRLRAPKRHSPVD